jgi:hypothetical protein
MHHPLLRPDPRIAIEKRLSILKPRWYNGFGKQSGQEMATNEVRFSMSQTLLPFKLGETQDCITAHAGLALFGEFLLSLGLLDALDRHLPPPGSPRGFLPSEFIQPLLLMLHGGGQTLEDLRMIRLDSALQTILEIERVPSSDATGDWLRRMAKKGKGLRGLKKVGDELLRRGLNQESIDSYTLDIDATQIVSEKVDARKTYKGETGYMPLVGHLAENGLVMHDEFRDGNDCPQSRNLEFIQTCQKRLPKGKRIAAFRSDSAAYQAEIINFCEAEKISFAIGGDLDVAVRNAIKGIPEDQWKPHGSGQIAETVHSMIETKKAFRIIVIRRRVQVMLDGTVQETDRYKVIATNLVGTPKEVEQWYNQRGETSENRIKDLKLGFGMDRMPCGTKSANAVFFRIGVLAYNLFQLFKTWALPPAYQRHTIATIRWQLYALPGKVVRHAGNLIVKLHTWARSMFAKIRDTYHELAWT